MQKNCESVVIARIRKLFALGNNNPNEHEANAAILKAHELMAEYGIHSVSSEEQISYSKEFCEHKGNRKFRKLLASVISKNFRCHFFIVNNTIAFFGRSEDAKIAKEVFEFAYLFAYKTSNKMYQDARNAGNYSKGIINSYAIGFTRGLSEKLGEQSTAMMVIIPPDVSTEYNEITKDFRRSTFSIKATTMNNAAFNQGVTDGKSLFNTRILESAS